MKVKCGRYILWVINKYILRQKVGTLLLSYLNHLWRPDRCIIEGYYRFKFDVNN